MTGTIELDRESSFQADKIENAASNWFLPAKLETAELSIAQPRPEEAFRWSGFSAQCARLLRGSRHSLTLILSQRERKPAAHLEGRLLGAAEHCADRRVASRTCPAHRVTSCLNAPTFLQVLPEPVRKE